MGCRIGELFQTKGLAKVKAQRPEDGWLEDGPGGSLGPAEREKGRCRFIQVTIFMK